MPTCGPVDQGNMFLKEMTLDTSSTRRRFLATSSGLAISALVGLPAIALAQDGDMPEIVVWAPQPGTSIYGGAAILKMAKGAAFFGAGAMTAASAIYGAVAVVGGTAAFADPEPFTKALLAALSGVIFLEALGLGGMAMVLQFIGADPPRSKYKVSVCKGAVTPAPQSVKGFPALNALSALLQTATTSARQFWDGIELWQGAKLADDGDWMTTHYKSCVEAYRNLYKAAQAMPAATQAMFEELQKSPKVDFKAIQAAMKPHAGKSLGNVPGFRDMVKKMSQKTPCGDGITRPALDLLMAQKVPKNLLQAIKQNIQEQKKFAKQMNKPI
jgi:hypothetical protein